MPHSPLLRELRRLFARVWSDDPTLSFPPLRLSRRAILLASSATVACGKPIDDDPGDPAMPTESPTTPPPEPTLPPPDRQVAVIGAGLGGLHCAWRLIEAGVPATVFEASDRTGGRLHTGRGLFADDQLCELGGELIDSDHATMWALSDEFSIPLDDLFAASAGLSSVFTMGGIEVAADTLVAQLTAIAPDLAKAARDAAIDDAAYAAIDATSLQAFLDDVCPRAIYPELHEALRITYVGEYGLELEQQSALNLLYLIDFVHPELLRFIGSSDERWRARDGNDTFATELSLAIGPTLQRFGHRLTAATDRSGGGVTLTFSLQDGTTVTWDFDRVVFALPFTALRQVDLTGLTLTAETRDAIDRLTYGTNSKVMAGFSSRVWSETHGGSGYLMSDAPLQSTWDSSAGQAGTAGILTNFVGGQTGVDCGALTATAWWAQILPDLEPTWPGISAAFTGAAVMAHWPSEPLALGSYSCLGPGDYVAISEHLGTTDGLVYFVGEHCSIAWQGWMEGAAITGADVAAQVLEALGVPQTQRHRALPRPVAWTNAAARRTLQAGG
jgi:monoamine oxidase